MFSALSMEELQTRIDIKEAELKELKMHLALKTVAAADPEDVRKACEKIKRNNHRKTLAERERAVFENHLSDQEEND